MTCLAFTPVLAVPAEIYRIIIIAIVMLGGAVLKKLTEAREQAERAKSPRPPAARPPATPPRRETDVRGAEDARNAGPTEPARSSRRDNPFRNEIEAFLEEVGRRSPAGTPARGESARGSASGGPPLARPIAQRQPQQSAPAPGQRLAGPAVRARSEPPKTVAQAAPLAPLRPGADMALRKAPVSDDLGAQVRAHLNAYLESSRLSQRARADLGSAIEAAVRDHLGTTTTRGSDSRDSLDASAQPEVPLATLLRNPTGVRTAILVNEILERPKCLRRKG